MSKIKIAVVFFFSLIFPLLISSCKDESTHPNLYKPAAFYGRVINQNEVTVSGAKVYVIYSFDDTTTQNSDFDSTFSLKQNYPNPFERGTAFEFFIPLKVM